MRERILKRVEQARHDLAEIEEQEADGFLGPGEADMKTADSVVQLIVDLQPLLAALAEQCTTKQ